MTKLTGELVLLKTKYQKNKAENEQSVLTLRSCLPCYIRDTAWNFFFLFNANVFGNNVNLMSIPLPTNIEYKTSYRKLDVSSSHFHTRGHERSRGSRGWLATHSLCVSALWVNGTLHHAALSCSHLSDEITFIVERICNFVFHFIYL